MYAAPGVGLAAPQIGRGIQLAVIEDREQYMKDWTPEQLAARERNPVPFQVIINPRLTLIGDETVEFFEGCLSVQGLMALVPRSRRVRVECLDESGQKRIIEASGWHARILQHEIDHLHGILYIDKMGPLGKLAARGTLHDFERKFRRAQERGEIPPDADLEKMLRDLEPKPATGPVM
jgi:peptide deformylase